MYNFDEVLDRTKLSAEKFLPSQPSQEGCIPVWVADMDFPAAAEIQKALLNRVQIPSYGYTNRGAAYDAAAIHWMKQRHHWDVQQKWLVTTPGVVPAMAFAVQAVVKPGEKVIIQSPVYPMFAKMIRSNGAEVVTNPLQLNDGRYEIDFDRFEQQAKDPNVKLFFLCNPHNPVGRVWSRDELQKLADICLANDVIIFSDDIHHDFVYGDKTYTPIASLSSDVSKITITATSPSKTFSLAGFKMANIWIEDDSLRRTFAAAVSRVGCNDLDIGAIESTIAAYTYGEQWLKEVLTYLESNNKLVDDFVAAHLPQVATFALEGTYLKWLDFRSLGMSGSELEAWSLNEAKVWFSEGYAFGAEGEGFKRMNLASSRHVLQEALERVEKALKRL